MTDFDPHGDIPLFPPRPADKARRRFLEVMARHFRDDDVHLSDDALVKAVLRRYDKARGEAIIDVSE